MKISYSLEETKDIITPALIYYRELLHDNIQTAIRTAHGAEHLWPHIKSHKMAELIRFSMEHGINRFKCATIAEAEIAAGCGAGHIVLSYPLVGPDISRFIRLAESCPNIHFYAIGDDLSALTLLGQSAGSSSLGAVDLLADANMGMDRTGVPLDKLERFCDACAQIPGITLRGLHCYDGHRTEYEYRDRKEQADSVDFMLGRLMTSLMEKYETCSVVIIGGSPSFPCHAEFMGADAGKDEEKKVFPEDAEIFFSPGTIFVYDYGYSGKFPDLPYTPAAAILTRVVSRPNTGIFTIDLGYKGIAADPQGVRGQLLGVEHCRELFQSEEHWTFKMDEGYEEECPKVGEELYVIPTHICPTSALYPSVIVAENGKITGEWEVSARNRRITF